MQRPKSTNFQQQKLLPSVKVPFQKDALESKVVLEAVNHKVLHSNPISNAGS